jgi:hypothetical protein
MISEYSNTISVTTLSSLLLDTYTGAAAAYSLRKLRAGYTGDAIEVRRASDNTTQDIGFVDGELDTTSLTSFCSGTNGFVTTWYDQSGNGYNATQSTVANQPQIVSSGSVILENGKAAVKFDGSDDVLSLNSVVNNPSTLAIICVFKHNNSLTAGVVYGYRDEATELIQLTAQTDAEYRLQIRSSGTAIQQITLTTTNKQILAFGQYNNITPLHSLYIDSTNSLTNSTSFSGNLDASTNSIGAAYTGDAVVEGPIQELILYPSDQSSNRSGIETNINDFYSIY